MISLIFTHTPTWVWVLLIALIYLGLIQTKRRTVSLTRSAILPIAMIGLSIFGTVSVFGSTATILCAWLGAAALMFVILMRFTNLSAVQYDIEKRQFTLPGSWVPMILILGIFITKYIVGMMTGMNPAYAKNLHFAITISLLYGAFSGIFLARAVSLWSMALTYQKMATTM